ncbi:hypothetical protein EIP86_011130 [Pleurotus ostreatoroseus]|nr:hypothetical protein EIP86_011130 [Pleurotus ostreatoroseus]
MTAVSSDAPGFVGSHADSAKSDEVDSVGKGVKGEEDGEGAHHNSGDRRKTVVRHLDDCRSRHGRSVGEEQAGRVGEEEEEADGGAQLKEIDKPHSGGSGRSGDEPDVEEQRVADRNDTL